MSNIATLIGITVFCSKCQFTYIFKYDDIEIGTDSGECELCGSHGKTEITFFCTHCNLYRDITVKEW